MNKEALCHEKGPQWLASGHPFQSVARPPQLDHEVVGRLADARRNDLADLDAKQVRPLWHPSEPLERALVGDLLGPPADLRVARPSARIVVVGVNRRAVNRQAPISPEVAHLERTGHHPEPGAPSFRRVASVFLTMASNSAR